MGLALTFDDGPDPVWTPAVLDALASAGAHATFFVIAPRAEQHPEIVARCLDEGHTVALHCDEHVRHGQRSEQWLRHDTERALGRLARVGVTPQLWRAPWGELAPHSCSVAAAFGLGLIGWDADTHDWRGDGAETMLASIAHRLVDGAVVLAHDALGPGALRGDCEQTVALVELVARRAAANGTALTALACHRTLTAR